jgi:hypothetical protein
VCEDYTVRFSPTTRACIPSITSGRYGMAEITTINLTERLRQGALELKELDKAILKDILEVRHERIFEDVEAFNEKRKALRKDLLHFSSYTIEDETARDIINKVQDNDEFQADWLVKSLLAQTGKAGGDKIIEDLTWLPDDELSDIAHEQFYSWIGPIDIAERLYKIGALILAVPTPNTLENYVTEARWCYAFGQYMAVYSLCRTILETAIREIGQEIGKLPRDEGNVKHDVLRRFHRMKEIVVPLDLANEVDEIYLPTCYIVHGRTAVGHEDASEMLRNTLKCVQKLYEYHHVRLGR